MAKAMLTNGADIRVIQEILGHEKLETTQKYTRLSIERLKQVHAATHPAAKLEPKAHGEGCSEPSTVPASSPAQGGRARRLRRPRRRRGAQQRHLQRDRRRGEKAQAGRSLEE